MLNGSRGTSRSSNTICEQKYEKCNIIRFIVICRRIPITYIDIRRVKTVKQFQKLQNCGVRTSTKKTHLLIHGQVKTKKVSPWAFVNCGVRTSTEKPENNIKYSNKIIKTRKYAFLDNYMSENLRFLVPPLDIIHSKSLNFWNFNNHVELKHLQNTWKLLCFSHHTAITSNPQEVTLKPDLWMAIATAWNLG